MWSDCETSKRRQKMTKRIRVRATLSALTPLLISILLIGCGSSNVRLGWSESKLPGCWHADYSTFEGVERTTFLAQQGQMVNLDYNVVVEKGSLTLKVVGPDGESLWEESFGEAADGAVTLRVSQKERYQVCVVGEDTGGSFDLSWHVEE
jgi:hypothetical protein